MRFTLLFCCLLPLCCEDLGAITCTLHTQQEGRDIVSLPQKSILFEQREVQGLLRDPSTLKDFIHTGRDAMATLIYLWSIGNQTTYEKILNDLARLGLGSCPDYSLILECHCVSSFYSQCGLIFLQKKHRFDESTIRFFPENIQGNTCVMKCYGPGVHFVDDYDGDSKSPGLRCRSLPWGLIKSLNFSNWKGISTSILIDLDIENLSCITGGLQCFAVMCLYRADGTYKAAVSLYFASLSPLFISTENAIGLALNAFVGLQQAQ